MKQNELNGLSKVELKDKLKGMSLLDLYKKVRVMMSTDSNTTVNNCLYDEIKSRNGRPTFKKKYF